VDYIEMKKDLIYWTHNGIDIDQYMYREIQAPPAAEKTYSDENEGLLFNEDIDKGPE
jgi:hypothetical protein